jgi:saccharopine dehydrogenase-like NADP-dependent oxidoreductase
MTKILVFGSEGNMGRATVWAAEQVWGRENVYSSDVIDTKDVSRYNYCQTKDCGFGETLEDIRPDIVFSCMPYFKNFELAKVCIELGIVYADLGGNVAVSESINELAKKYKSRVYTDLGLAPGLVNLMAENMVRKADFDPSVVTMMCGGLPLDPSDYPLGYFCNWSIDGLYNEYHDDCIVIRDYEPVKVPGLSELQKTNIESWGEQLEAFCTSGGLAHSVKSLSRIRNVTYKTLRYSGHAQQVALMPKSILAEKVKPKSSAKDIIIIKITVSDDDDNFISRELTIWDSKRFSAMQRATAFSMVATVSTFENKEPGELVNPHYCSMTKSQFARFKLFFDHLLTADRMQL